MVEVGGLLAYDVLWREHVSNEVDSVENIVSCVYLQYHMFGVPIYNILETLRCQKADYQQYCSISVFYHGNFPKRLFQWSAVQSRLHNNNAFCYLIWSCVIMFLLIFNMQFNKFRLSDSVVSSSQSFVMVSTNTRSSAVFSQSQSGEEVKFSSVFCLFINNPALFLSFLLSSLLNFLIIVS